jgi:hypothetical protein
MKFLKMAMPAMAMVLLLICAVNAQDETPKVTKPVPVVPQPKDEKIPPKVVPTKKVTGGEDAPPVAADEDSAVLPLNFVKNKLDSMPMGTKAYINVDAIKCDNKRRMYLDPESLYGIASEDRIIQISKDANGYHIVLEKIEHQWVCQELPPGVKLLSVKTVMSK